MDVDCSGVASAGDGFACGVKGREWEKLEVGLEIAAYLGSRHCELMYAKFVLVPLLLCMNHLHGGPFQAACVIVPCRGFEHLLTTAQEAIYFEALLI